MLTNLTLLKNATDCKVTSEVEISLPEEETSTATANNEYPSCTGVISQCTDYIQTMDF